MTHFSTTSPRPGQRDALASGQRGALLAVIALAIATAVAAIFAIGAPPAQAMKLKTLVAPAQECPRQNSTNTSPFLQERAMRCLINQARERVGLRTLDQSLKLRRSTDQKVRDMQVCKSFDHYACGRDFSYWIEQTGFAKGCWRAAENIAWGERELGSPRQIFAAWLRSEPHRENIFAGEYSRLGVGVRSGPFEGRNSVQVWTMHLGHRC